MVEIDGAQGEGGGQIVRTALALSALTGTPVRVDRIRVGRERPGLAPQHLTVVRALAALCAATVEGDQLRSTALQFYPTRPPQAGPYAFDVRDAADNGSAGAVTLLLQALLLPLAAADTPSTLTLQGGTHVAWSPSFHYLRDVFGPMIRPMGLQLEATLAAYGFYPAGGGAVEARIEPAPEGTVSGCPLALHPLTRSDRGALEGIHGMAAVSNLPAHIPRRMKQRAAERLRSLGGPVAVETECVAGAGPGAGLFLTVVYENARAGFSAVGAPGRPAEQVADRACEALERHHAAGAAVDPHLADQLLLPMACATGSSCFTTSAVTQHLRTNAAVIRRFLPVTFAIEGEGVGAAGRVTVRPDAGEQQG